jgi:cytidine deaminase
MDKKSNLMELAEQVRAAAYVPYSGYRVGAALLCTDGTVYTGSNIENAAFTPTICAERVAFFKAVNEGKFGFTALAVAGGKGSAVEDCVPCGVCRQVMQEFCDPDTFLILVHQAGEVKSYLLRELLPMGFGRNHVKGEVGNAGI